MLRRSLTTLLVCLAISISMAAGGPVAAQEPDESLDVLIKPRKGTGAPEPLTHKAKSRYRVRRTPIAPSSAGPYPPPLRRFHL